MLGNVHMTSPQCTLLAPRNKRCSIFAPQTMQSWALKTCVAFIPNSVLVTLLTQALGTRGAGAVAQNNQQAVGAHLVAQQDTYATSTESLQQQGVWPMHDALCSCRPAKQGQ